MKWTNYKNARFLLLLAFLTLFSIGRTLNWPNSYKGQIHPIDPSVQKQNTEYSAGFDESTIVELTTKDGITVLSMKDYLLGVLQAELPARFSLQTMKAQTVAARTVAVKKMQKGQELCDDPNCCQAFISGKSTDSALMAVEETNGEVLIYEGELIEAVYFSCSGGVTEAAVDVWGNEVAYLQSVESPGEEDAPHYQESITVPIQLFRQTLQIKDQILQIKDPVLTASGGVKTIEINGHTFTGTEIRSLFALRSTCFEIVKNELSVTFRCKGFGHRVGMSQYGAQAMAESGADYHKILAHYYRGAEIKKQS